MAVQVGLVGYGLAGEIFHAPLISSVAGLQLAAVFSSNPAKVQRDYPSLTVEPSLEQLLAHDEITSVVIATPNTTHFEFAKQAILAGKHVVVDKPFTITSADADVLIALAQEHHVLLSVYQSRRWDNDFKTIRRMLQSQLLGDISTYEEHYDRFRLSVTDRWRDQAIPGSGMLYDLGAHLIDHALTLFGVPLTVQATVQAIRPGGVVDDYFHIVLGYPEHRNVILHSSIIVREPGPRFQINGTKGSFIKYGLDSQEDALKAGKRPGDPGWGEDPSSDYGCLTMDIDGLTVNGTIQTLRGGYEGFYQDWAAAITDGKPVPVDPMDSRNVIRTIELALQSQAEQRTIPFSVS